jgi:hypothetical protein
LPVIPELAFVSLAKRFVALVVVMISGSELAAAGVVLPVGSNSSIFAPPNSSSSSSLVAAAAVMESTRIAGFRLSRFDGLEGSAIVVVAVGAVVGKL